MPLGRACELAPFCCAGTVSSHYADSIPSGVSKGRVVSGSCLSPRPPAGQACPGHLLMGLSMNQTQRMMRLVSSPGWMTSFQSTCSPNAEGLSKGIRTTQGEHLQPASHVMLPQHCACLPARLLTGLDGLAKMPGITHRPVPLGKYLPLCWAMTT